MKPERETSICRHCGEVIVSEIWWHRGWAHVREESKNAMYRSCLGTDTAAEPVPTGTLFIRDEKIL